MKLANVILPAFIMVLAPSLRAQVWCEQGRLLAGDAAPGNAMYPVSVSGDTAIAGAIYVANNTGATYVFIRSGDVWNQAVKLTASDGAPGDVFGAQLTLQGTTAAIASPSGGGGSVYVFTGAGPSWTEITRLRSNDLAAEDNFGSAVALDGDTMLIGNNFDGDLGPHSGSAYVFERIGGTWTQTQKLLGSNIGSGDNFGTSVGVSGDVAVIGCELRNTAYVFIKLGSVWSEQMLLDPVNGGGNEAFGQANAVAIDHETILIGAHRDDELFVDAGAAYVFIRTGSTWSLQAKLFASDGGPNERFGKSVAIQGDRVVVGAVTVSGDGAAYVFDRNGSTWAESAKLTITGGGLAASPEFGRVVDVDGDTAIGGAPGDDGAAVDAGAAYVFHACLGGFASYCHPGIDGVVACPCGNSPANPGQGCNNFGAMSGGATLSGAGTASLAADSLVLTSLGENQSSLSLFVQGSSSIPAGVSFGAGVRCVSGELKRLYTGFASAGSISRPRIGDPSISVRSAALGDQLSGCAQRYYMVYYRDPLAAAPCGLPSSTFNCTQGGSICWIP